MSELKSIIELEAAGTRIRAGSYELRLWSNGTYFLESPSGEGTEVPEEAVEGALAHLFRIFF